MATYNLRKAHTDFTDQVIPIYRDRYGKLFVTKDHNNVDGERITSFASQAEMMQAMELRHPTTGKDLYQTDPLYRSAIEGLLASTDAKTVGIATEPMQAIPTDDVMMRGLAEDAARQRYQELVDRAGGNDAVAKYELARILQNPTPEEREGFLMIDRATTVQRPMEDYLKSRRAAGLGPQKDSIAFESVADLAAKEQAHNNEIMDWLDANETDGDLS